MEESQSPTGSLAAQLRAYRRAAGMSQEMLAEAAGLSVNGVGSLERGTRQAPYPDTLRRLADALNLTPDQRAALFRAAPAPATPEPEPHSPSLHTNLRADPTSFVGRQAALDDLAAILNGPRRLVTLTGPGGVGKTRLAVETGRSLAAAFPNGVWFVDLAPVREADQSFDALAEQVAPLVGARLDRDRLAPALDLPRRLVILDNVEQIARFPEALAALVNETSHIRFLVTSRTPLRIRPERVVTVPPLIDDPGPGETGLDAAMDLFVERAQALSPAFAVTAENRETIAAICQQTGGIPLAIELAAARAPSIPLPVLLSRLREGLDPLSRGMRDVPARQQTMRATIDWSVNLLGADQRELLAMLSVFQGGCAYETASLLHESLRPEGGPGFDDLLADLMDAALVAAAPGDGAEPPRLRMLVPIHAYASEMLPVDRRGELRHLHAALYRRLVLHNGQQDTQGRSLAWLRSLVVEQHNLHAAIDALLDDGDLSGAVEMIWALWRFWWLAGMQPAARRWLAQIVASAGGGPALLDDRRLGQALVAQGSFTWAMGNDALATGMLERGLATAVLAGDGHVAAIAETLLGVIGIRAGNLDAAEDRLAAAMARPVVAGDPWLRSWTLAYAGVIAMLRKRYGQAQEHLAASLRLARSIDDQTAMSEPYYYLGLLSLLRGDRSTAAALLRDGLEVAAVVGEPLLLCHYLKTIARAFVTTEDDANAIEAVADRILVARGAPWYLDHLSKLLETESTSAAPPFPAPERTPAWSLNVAVESARASLRIS